MGQIGLCLSGHTDLSGKNLTYLLSLTSPKKGQFEEYGILAYGMWLHWLVTGDNTIIKSVWKRLCDFMDEPFIPERYNPDTNLCISVTEGYWERDWLGMGYSLSQHCWLILGLQCMTEMAEIPGVSTKLGRLNNWNERLNAIRNRIFGKEKGCMIHKDTFVKRLKPDLSVQWKGPLRHSICAPRQIRPTPIPKRYKFKDGVMRDLMPDVQQCVPYLWELWDPKDKVSLNTSDWISKLWNQFWDFGGMGRYNVLSDPDIETSGPWYFAGLMFARALALQDRYKELEKIINWTLSEGAAGFTWAERVSQCHPRNDDDRYIQSLMTWTYGEWLMLFLREVLGLRYSPKGLSIRPHVPLDWGNISARNIRFGKHKFDIKIIGSGSTIAKATLNDKETDLTNLKSGGRILIKLI